MCGIGGVFAAAPDRPIERGLLERMNRSLRHRGPDGSGVRLGPGYGLAHTRLAIVDRSGGDQPMGLADGSLWLVFNGEIYNHEALRAELEAAGARFRTRCDTEVLLHGWRRWGPDLVSRLRGMFAFALVDEREWQLFLARDRLGMKPLYYAELEDRLLFASEPKALLTDPDVDRQLAPEAIARYFALRYVPDPDSIFRSIRSLPPGHSLHLVQGGAPRVERYWRPRFHPGSQPRDPAALGEELLAKLDESVRIRLMGEVPLGAFLSGGVDSTAVVDSMARVSDGSVVACSVGFGERDWDERPVARATAARIGAQLHEGEVSPGDMADLDWFTEVFDEPFADASAIPTWHVSRLARQHVVVALSGDGGDESFLGYRRYRFDDLERRIRRCLPTPLWRALGRLYPKLDFLPRWLRFKRTLQNLGCAPDLAYARSVSANLPEDLRGILRGSARAALDGALDPIRRAYREADVAEADARPAAADFEGWLPGDILTKVDRASMAVSLEVRCPLLDHELVELAAGIPVALKRLGGEAKGLLRQALRARLSRQVLDGPKRGFGVPLRDWFRGALGESLERELLQVDGPLAEHVDVAAMRPVLEEHRRGLRDHGELLWAVLVFSRFQRRWCA